MTDNEIIKALECCATGNKCNDCPLDTANCLRDLPKSALDLINRQKAEKEALINGQETLQKYIAEQKAEIERLQRLGASATRKMVNARAEAITEFMERANEKAFHDMNDGEAVVCCCDLDQIAKEMKEGVWK